VKLADGKARNIQQNLSFSRLEVMVCA